MMENRELPRGWVRARLGQVANYGSVKKIEFASVEQDAWTLELEDIEKDTSRILKKISVSERPFKSTKNIFHKGDVLYGKLRPYLNKIVLANNNGICSTEIVPINAEPCTSNYYLFYWLKGCEFSAYVNNVSYGVNMPRLGTKDGNLAPLILPPLAEQQEIVRIIESHLQLVDQIKSRLDALPKILEQFRQSVLASAVSGKLTDIEVKEVRVLEDYVSIENGARKPVSAAIRKGIQGEIPYIGATGVIDYLNDRTHVGRYLLVGEDGANLLTKTKDLAFIFDGEMWVNNHAHVLKEREGVDLDFIKIVINAMDLKPWVTGSAQPKLTQRALRALPIPYCLESEQKEIVKRVENFFTLADQIESKIKHAQERVNLLTQSILAKAFRGEFTAKWREDNPDLISGENSAGALLKRIEEAKKTAKKKK